MTPLRLLTSAPLPKGRQRVAGPTYANLFPCFRQCTTHGRQGDGGLNAVYGMRIRQIGSVLGSQHSAGPTSVWLGRKIRKVSSTGSAIRIPPPSPPPEVGTSPQRARQGIRRKVSQGKGILGKQGVSKWKWMQRHSAPREGNFREAGSE